MSTPSSRLQLRKQNPQYRFGPWYDHYVKPFGKCHPSFETHLLSCDPRGVKVCVRRDDPSWTYAPCSTFIPGHGQFVGGLYQPITDELYTHDYIKVDKYEKYRDSVI